VERRGPGYGQVREVQAGPLADFGSVAFSGATANGLPVNPAGLVDTQITMTKNKKGTVT